MPNLQYYLSITQGTVYNRVNKIILFLWIIIIAGHAAIACEFESHLTFRNFTFVQNKAKLSK